MKAMISSINFQLFTIKVTDIFKDKKKTQMVVESWVYLIVIHSIFFIHLQIYIKFVYYNTFFFFFFDMKTVGYTVNFNNT